MAGLKLFLLGGFELLGNWHVAPTLTRKSRGLLAYLALHPDHAQSREKLAAMFWSAVPDAQARTNLRQALSSLRRVFDSFDGTKLLTDGDGVALHANELFLDVTQFEDLIANGTTDSLEKALTLYRGDLFDGFSLKEDAFEQWAAIERSRLRLQAIEALEVLVAHYREVQDHARWTRSAMHLLTLDPLREDIHREVMRIHAAQGNLNAAIKQYEVCCELLRRELGIQPDSQTRNLCRELRNHRELSEITPRPASWRNATILESGNTAVSDTRMSADTWAATQVDLSVPAKPSVAVLPFADESDGQDQIYFANGLAENIVAGLTRFRDLFVIAFSSSRLANDASRDIVELGRRLGVAHLVIGTVRKAGNRLRVMAQLIDTGSGQRIWAERYDRSFGDVFDVQDEITSLIVATLAGHIEQANRHRSVHKPAGQLSAYDYLLRARECMRQGAKPDELAARSYLDRALTSDPEYAAAYAAYALSYIHEYEAPWSLDRAAARNHALDLARKAVALDETDSIARRALAYAAHYCGQIELAKKEVETALALNPNDYSNMCIKAWILNFGGQPEKGLACRDRSLRINPFAPDGCLFDAGIALYMLRRYEESAESFARMSKWNLLRDSCLAACYAQLSQDNDARRAANYAWQSMKTEYGDNTTEALGRWRDYIWSVLKFRRAEDHEHLMAGLRKSGLAA